MKRCKCARVAFKPSNEFHVNVVGSGGGGSSMRVRNRVCDELINYLDGSTLNSVGELKNQIAFFPLDTLWPGWF